VGVVTVEEAAVSLSGAATVALTGAFSGEVAGVVVSAGWLPAFPFYPQDVQRITRQGLTLREPRLQELPARVLLL
jgi:hypothetical protein